MRPTISCSHQIWTKTNYTMLFFVYCLFTFVRSLCLCVCLSQSSHDHIPTKHNTFVCTFFRCFIFIFVLGYVMSKSIAQHGKEIYINNIFLSVCVIFFCFVSVLSKFIWHLCETYKCHCTFFDEFLSIDPLIRNATIPRTHHSNRKTTRLFHEVFFFDGWSNHDDDDEWIQCNVSVQFFLVIRFLWYASSVSYTHKQHP